MRIWKFIFNVALLLVLCFWISPNVNAAESDAYTGQEYIFGSTEPLCGFTYPRENETNKCCVYTEDNADISQYLQGEWGCVTFLCVSKWCLSDVMSSVTKIYRSVKKYFNVGQSDYIRCFTGKPSGEGDACVCTGITDQKMCDRYLANSPERADCSRCMSSDTGYYSAIGCIKLDSFGGLISAGILTPLLSLGGLITLLLIIYSAILIMTSSGDPEKIKKAKETLTSALVGLIFIILSIFILKFISGDLFGINLGVIKPK